MTDLAAPAEPKVEDWVGENERRQFEVEVKAGAGERELDFTISTSSVDRMGDTIAVEGWQLDNYRKNPTVLWSHDPSMPVGRASNVRVEDGRLMATTEFFPAHNPQFGKMADGLFQLYRDGYLKATSVGFKPLTFAFSDDPNRKMGVDFKEQELLEFSMVAIPANAEALISAKSAGICVDPLIDWAFKHMDDEKIAAAAEAIALRQDLFASDLVARVNAAAGVAVLTPERLRQIENVERIAKQERIRRKRARDLDLARLRA